MLINSLNHLIVSAAKNKERAKKQKTQNPADEKMREKKGGGKEADSPWRKDVSDALVCINGKTV